MKMIDITKGFQVMVDDEDYDELIKWKWCCKVTPHTIYARRGTTVKGKSIEIKMHRQVMGLAADSSMVVDHIDGNGLNNQKKNLRICTKGQNVINSRKRVSATSSYKGVSYNASKSGKNKWLAQIYLNYKNTYLGRYKTEMEAAIAYDEKAKEIHGEFALLNFPIDKTLHPSTIS